MTVQGEEPAVSPDDEESDPTLQTAPETARDEGAADRLDDYERGPASAIRRRPAQPGAWLFLACGAPLAGHT